MVANPRAPLQGIKNIVRFNWPFYGLAIIGLVGGFWLATWLGGNWLLLGIMLSLLVIFTIIGSLLASWYVYDVSDLYSLDWLGDLGHPANIVNIHAGFDETSALLASRFPGAKMRVLDFYDPELHTEASIKRARKAYPSYPGTKRISTDKLPLEDNSVNVIFLIFSAHEIRQPKERAEFFRLLYKALQPGGHIILVEHLRDLPNFLAYSFGAFHFLSEKNWQQTFAAADFSQIEKENVNSFVVKFTLTKKCRYTLKLSEGC